MSNESKKNFVCPEDRRRFKTAAGLAAHNRAVHGTGAGNKPARKRKPRARKARVVQSGDRKVTGTDMLGLINIVAPGKVGDPLLRVQISPRRMAGTRLFAESQLWSRWRPVSLKIRLVSSASSYVGGMYSVGWCANAEERLPRAVAAVSKIATYRPNVASQIFASSSLSVPVEASRKWYLLEAPAEDASHGVVHAALAAPLNNLTNGSAVSLYVHLDWTVEFSGPDLPSTEDVDTIYAEDDFTPYFTDSVGDWASGEKLTLKEREGGSVVPFPNAEPGVVYKIDSGANLQAYTSATEQAKIVYGVLIRNYHVPGLAVFTNQTLAYAYAESGDDADCMRYFAAGGYVTPVNPAWMAQNPLPSLDIGDVAAPQLPASQAGSGQAVSGQQTLLADPRVVDACELLASLLSSVHQTLPAPALRVFSEDPVRGGLARRPRTDPEESSYDTLG